MISFASSDPVSLVPRTSAEPPTGTRTLEIELRGVQPGHPHQAPTQGVQTEEFRLHLTNPTGKDIELSLEPPALFFQYFTVLLEDCLEYDNEPRGQTIRYYTHLAIPETDPRRCGSDHRRGGNTENSPLNCRVLPAPFPPPAHSTHPVFFIDSE